MKRVMMLVALVAAGGMVACGDDQPKPSLPDSGTPVTVPTPDPPAPTPDAGAPSIPLQNWVHAMVDQGGGDGNGGMPDTVDDKIGIVKDTDDPAAFDEFVPPAP